MNVTNVIYGEEDYLDKKELDDTLRKNINHKMCNCLDYKKDINGNFVFDKEKIEFNRCTSHPTTEHGFCDRHKDCFQFMKLFTNDEEIDYKPEKWNDNIFKKGSHNCYAYFLDAPNDSLTVKCKDMCKNNTKCVKNNTCQTLIPQPGDALLIEKNGNTKKKKSNYTCKTMIKRIKVIIMD